MEAREFNEQTFDAYESDKSELNWEKHEASSMEMMRLENLYRERNKALRILNFALMQATKQMLKEALEKALRNV